MRQAHSRTAIHAVALAIALAVTGGCAEPQVPGSVQAAVAATAEFRFEAGEVYENLTLESCASNPSLRRALVLAGEAEAVRAFEQRLRGTPLAFHLTVARSDALHRIAVEGGCWEDSDPDFAARHVQMARNSVRAGLQRLEALAPALAELPPAVGASAGEAAEFRYHARRLLEGLAAPCPVSARAENDAILAPARAELQRFRQRLDGSPHAIHYDLADADAAYHWSITEVECAEPDSGPPAELRREALEQARRGIDELEARRQGPADSDSST